MFFNSLFYVFAAKQQLPNENKNHIFKNVYFENFASQSSVLQITFCVYFCLGYYFYLLCLIFDEVMITCIVITRGLYHTNRTIEFEEYILKEDYHGKSSNIKGSFLERSPPSSCILSQRTDYKLNEPEAGYEYSYSISSAPPF